VKSGNCSGIEGLAPGMLFLSSGASRDHLLDVSRGITPSALRRALRADVQGLIKALTTELREDWSATAASQLQSNNTMNRTGYLNFAIIWPVIRIRELQADGHLVHVCPAGS
jgi:hypothetical protein